MCLSLPRLKSSVTLGCGRDEGMSAKGKKKQLGQERAFIRKVSAGEKL